MAKLDWKKLDDRLLQKTRVFDLRVKLMRFPNGQTEDDFYYIHAVNWVNIIPITVSGEVIFVKQFRHGIDAPTLETPGGLVDNNLGDPLDTAKRELKEETGYESQNILSLGWLHPNPAMINNKVFLYAALDATLTGTQDLEPAEDITLHSFHLREIPQLFKDGLLTHSITAAAFHLLSNQHPEVLEKYK